jgi:hypothetical protein
VSGGLELVLVLVETDEWLDDERLELARDSSLSE